MRKLLAVLAGSVVLVALLLGSKPGYAAENVDSYQSAIVINQDGTINVTETIVYNFNNTPDKHGIYRDIPRIITNSDGAQYRMRIDLLSVQDERGSNYAYSDQTTPETFSLIIGDANQLVTGVQKYLIRYRVSGALRYFSDHDELYWNILGTHWKAPFTDVSAQISLPAGVTGSETRLQCYTGVEGSNGSDCMITASDNTISATASRVLQSFEGMTVVVGFPINKVAVLEPEKVISFFDTAVGKVVLVLILIGVLVWYLILPVVIVWKWFKSGRDPKEPTAVTAWFDPPKTKTGRPLTPAETSTLINENSGLQEISATIVSLAQRGLMRIEERKKHDFYLVKVKDWEGDVSIQPFEKTLLDGIFSTGAERHLKNAELVTTVTNVKKQIMKALLDEQYFVGNPQTYQLCFGALGVLALVTADIPLALASFIFGRNLARKTQTGVEAVAVAKGLKHFLTSQERQLEFQADKQMMFEKLLPYAVAFGVEKIWSERFKDIALTQPNWYQTYDNRMFNSLLFASALNNSFNSIRSAATPVRSTTGSSSGFGGGFSGGGGGGGGGGSW